MRANEAAMDQFERGMDRFDSGRTPAARDHFRAAHSLQPENPMFRSYYGMSLGLVERRFTEALELCQSAAKQQFFDPAVYHNLARIHLSFGFKSEGIRYLKRGLMIDPSNRAIAGDLKRLGVRRPAVLPVLPRRHLLNRLLGRIRSRFAQRPAASAHAARG